MNISTSLKYTLVTLFIASSVHATAIYTDITAVGSSAEMIGIGSVQGFSNQASVLLESPVGLAFAPNSVSAFYTSYFDTSAYMTGAVSYQLSENVVIGVAAAYQRSDNLDTTATNNAGEYVSAGQFSVDNLQLTTGLAYSPLKTLHLGASWTEYASNIYDVHGVGGDLSLALLYQTPIADILLNGKNILGNSVAFSNATTETLQTQWSLGFKSSPLPLFDTQVFGQVKQLSGIHDLAKSLGVRVYPLNTKLLSLSLGYNEKPAVSTVKGTLTAGVILNVDSLSLEYAYDTTDVYQNAQQHYFSMSVKY